MGALWFMNNERFLSMDEGLRRVIVDGFDALQQATFASPKRKEIAAYEEFVEAGGDIYVPTPEEKAQFQEAATPVYDWFRENVDRGDEVLDMFMAAVEEAQAEVDAARAADLN